jgi:EmrB/QacA subfamily drug resistance transporter
VAQDDSRKWSVLVLLCITQLILVLDISIVNVALTDIQKALDFSLENLQWVVSAYTLTFGGFLLLGGRMGDLFGRRRLFLIGLAVFALASLTCGLSQSDGMLIGARAVQGIGAAIIAPVSLSILTTTFAEGAERNKALGIWGGIAGAGGAIGVLAGGVLTNFLGWEWIFLVNVPIAATVFFLIPRFVSESRAENLKGLDIAGSVTGTAGLAGIVYGLVHAQTDGWGNSVTIAVLVASVALLGSFLFIESRSKSPILPLSIFKLRTLAGANIVGFLLGCAIFAMFYFLSLYMQQVLGYDALGTGLRYLLVAIVIIVAAGASQALVTRLGVRPILAGGMFLLTLGLLWFTMVSVNGSYTVDLVPGFILAGIGLGASFVPVSIAALQGVTSELAGVASGLINTSQQIGGALGIAILSTVANTVTENNSPTGSLQGASPQSVVDGLSAAFWVGAGMAVIGLLATLLVIQKVRMPDAEAEVAPAVS